MMAARRFRRCPEWLVAMARVAGIECVAVDGESERISGLARVPGSRALLDGARRKTMRNTGAGAIFST